MFEREREPHLLVVDTHVHKKGVSHITHARVYDAKSPTSMIAHAGRLSEDLGKISYCCSYKDLLPLLSNECPNSYTRHALTAHCLLLGICGADNQGVQDHAHRCQEEGSGL
jgi:hypothetical protein